MAKKSDALRLGLSRDFVPDILVRDAADLLDEAERVLAELLDAHQKIAWATKDAPAAAAARALLAKLRSDQ